MTSCGHFSQYTSVVHEALQNKRDLTANICTSVAISVLFICIRI